MSLIQDMQKHASAQVNSGEWSSVASILRLLRSEQPVARLCGSVETADTVAASGNSHPILMTAMSQDAVGAFLLNKLAGDGVAWAHRLTVPYLEGLVAKGALNEAGKAALIELSQPAGALLYPDITALACETAWKNEQRRLRDIELKTRFDATLNQLDSVENAAGVQALRDMANEFEVQE